ncbi:hypothetical protein K9M18_05675, partial [Candidatus Woesearchaeota archaeon]|nr:hypothetical protein [Candidatus Woesearchaeota archaeon]
MLLKKVILKNIRSYKELEINFKEGSTLLSGDIGAGKTTILLSIEFALFGLIRGHITGSTLLRHGEKEGSVTMQMQIDNKEVIIKRNLKRTSNTIAQESGHIQIGEEKKEMTAIELKSKILELLGYPEELLTKSKSLIYRYTVYTPQEEMKQILFESPDERLEKIRKLFEIDKYKRIKENASNYTKNLRSEIKNSAWLIEGIDGLKESKKQIIKEKEIFEKEIKILETQIKEAKEKENKQKEQIEKILDKEKELAEIKNKIKLIETEIKNIIENIEQINNTIKRYEDEILEIKKENESSESKQLIETNSDKNIEIQKNKNAETIEKEIQLYENKQKETEEKLNLARNKKAISQSKIQSAQELISKIDSLENCPTCKQPVTEEHKKHVEQDEKNKINEEQEKIIKYENLIEKAT